MKEDLLAADPSVMACDQALATLPVHAAACGFFADDSVDYAYSTLTLHHLGDEDAVNFLREMARVTRRRYSLSISTGTKPRIFYRLFISLFFKG
jgi:ubiquinone/menaquinone biosynthesis C-methylase UbiE